MNGSPIEAITRDTGGFTGKRAPAVCRCRRDLTALLASQVAQPGRLTVDIVTFDDEVERVCSMADPQTVTIELIPRGSTALHDAVGRSVREFGAILTGLTEDARPETVQVVVVTDGGENSSTERTAATVKKSSPSRRRNMAGQRAGRGCGVN